MVIRLLGLWMVLSLTACSGFRGEWKRAMATPAPSGDITGPWEGTWHSMGDGHNDKLFCVVTKQSETNYLAFFHAKYLKILSYSHKVPLEVTRTNNQFTFRGSADLGFLGGGVYHYTGRATPDHFHSDFSSKKYKGVFEMRRPASQ